MTKPTWPKGGDVADTCLSLGGRVDAEGDRTSRGEDQRCEFGKTTKESHPDDKKVKDGPSSEGCEKNFGVHLPVRQLQHVLPLGLSIGGVGPSRFSKTRRSSVCHGGGRQGNERRYDQSVADIAL